MFGSFLHVLFLFCVSSSFCFLNLYFYQSTTFWSLVDWCLLNFFGSLSCDENATCQIDQNNYSFVWSHITHIQYSQKDKSYTLTGNIITKYLEILLMIIFNLLPSPLYFTLAVCITSISWNNITISVFNIYSCFKSFKWIRTLYYTPKYLPFLPFQVFL